MDRWMADLLRADFWGACQEFRMPVWNTFYWHFIFEAVGVIFWQLKFNLCFCMIKFLHVSHLLFPQVCTPTSTSIRLMKTPPVRPAASDCQSFSASNLHTISIPKEEARDVCRCFSVDVAWKMVTNGIETQTKVVGDLQLGDKKVTAWITWKGWLYGFGKHFPTNCKGPQSFGKENIFDGPWTFHVPWVLEE